MAHSVIVPGSPLDLMSTLRRAITAPLIEAIHELRSLNGRDFIRGGRGNGDCGRIYSCWKNYSICGKNLRRRDFEIRRTARDRMLIDSKSTSWRICAEGPRFGTTFARVFATLRPHRGCAHAEVWEPWRIYERMHSVGDRSVRLGKFLTLGAAGTPG
jgi:hypothetical protein